MERPIEAFQQDDEGHWVADLSCGHTQHRRHNPPFADRPWVLTEEGRSDRLGTSLDCLLCDRSEMPAGHGPYQRTKSFDADTVPKGLKANHTTKRGVWALIHVETGELDFALESVQGEPAHVERLRPGKTGLIVAEVEHRVTPVGEVSFYVEFWRRSTPDV